MKNTKISKHVFIADTARVRYIFRAVNKVVKKFENNIQKLHSLGISTMTLADKLTQNRLLTYIIMNVAISFKLKKCIHLKDTFKRRKFSKC